MTATDLALLFTSRQGLFPPVRGVAELFKPPLQGAARSPGSSRVPQLHHGLRDPLPSDPQQLGEGLGLKETPQQKYQRLLHEVQELSSEVEKIQVSTWPCCTQGQGSRIGSRAYSRPPLFMAEHCQGVSGRGEADARGPGQAGGRPQAAAGLQPP